MRRETKGETREAQGGPGTRTRRMGETRKAQGGEREEGRGRAKGGVGPRTQWAQRYLRLSDNCCCH